MNLLETYQAFKKQQQEEARQRQVAEQQRIDDLERHNNIKIDSVQREVDRQYQVIRERLVANLAPFEKNLQRIGAANIIEEVSQLWKLEPLEIPRNAEINTIPRKVGFGYGLNLDQYNNKRGTFGLQELQSPNWRRNVESLIGFYRGESAISHLESYVSDKMPYIMLPQFGVNEAYIYSHGQVFATDYPERGLLTEYGLVRDLHFTSKDPNSQYLKLVIGRNIFLEIDTLDPHLDLESFIAKALSEGKDKYVLSTFEPRIEQDHDMSGA